MFESRELLEIRIYCVVTTRYWSHLIPLFQQIRSQSVSNYRYIGKELTELLYLYQMRVTREQPLDEDNCTAVMRTYRRCQIGEPALDLSSQCQGGTVLRPIMAVPNNAKEDNHPRET